MNRQQKDPVARISPVRADERTAEAREIIDIFAGTARINVDDNPVLNTFCQHPQLAKAFLPFNNYLLKSSTLPVRLRQVAILRVCWLKNARYMWSSHLRTSLLRGFDGEEFAQVKRGAESEYWTDQERYIIKATDQLLEEGSLDNRHWDGLKAFLSTEQLMDLLFTVGTYVLLSLAINSIGIEREDELLVLAARFGAPEF
ncbi:carboxymuconolactone decarboxylase family protein [Pseudomaricurvus sp. HS19]|uniref:carboxymuconolactone decarboxylase family protein n=1 Tax=Pseudomaricurvus sp. HS19 TaxID=2692626 RepID=UPI00136C8368